MYFSQYQAAHFRVVSYCDQSKTHMCNNHAVQSAPLCVDKRSAHYHYILQRLREIALLCAQKKSEIFYNKNAAFIFLLLKIIHTLFTISAIDWYTHLPPTTTFLFLQFAKYMYLSFMKCDEHVPLSSLCKQHLSKQTFFYCSATFSNRGTFILLFSI